MAELLLAAHRETGRSPMVDPQGDRDVGSDDEADGELKKAEDAYANECNAKPLNSRNMQQRERDKRERERERDRVHCQSKRERERARESCAHTVVRSGGSR